jgi:alpha-L-fucosidase
LLLNIGPAPDGSVPEENLPVLKTIGNWLHENGEAVYGNMSPCHGLVGGCAYGNYGGPILSRQTAKGPTIYIWQLIWPKNGELAISGYYRSGPRRVRLLRDASDIKFEYRDGRIILKNLPLNSPDLHANVPVVALEFDKEPEYLFCSGYSHIQQV